MKESLHNALSGIIDAQIEIGEIKSDELLAIRKRFQTAHKLQVLMSFLDDMKTAQERPELKAVYYSRWEI